MIKTKNKLVTCIVLVLILLLLTGIRGFDYSYGVASFDINTISELEGKSMGGIISKMPDNSAKIFFETMLGEPLRNYRSYEGINETIAALKTNEIQVAWFSDVTAEYLLKVEPTLRELVVKENDKPRLDFGFALKQGNQSLRDALNNTIAQMQQDGVLEQLIAEYIDTNDFEAVYQSRNLQMRQVQSETNQADKVMYVGVTGAVPPIDMVDMNNQPYGFSLALMKEIGKRLGYSVRFIVMKNDTAFSGLMGGKVDLLFCYGTSKNTVSPESDYNYIMTQGYYSMYQYSYLVLE